MAAPTVAQIREGLAVNLDVIPDVTVNAYMQPTAEPPLLYVYPDRADYDKAMGRGLDEWQFKLQALVGLLDDVDSQKLLDLMIAPAGASSVKQAAESDETLGGKVASVSVVDFSDYRSYLLEGQGAVLGCLFSVQILATGK